MENQLIGQLEVGCTCSRHCSPLRSLPRPILITWPSPTHLVRVKQFPEALLELHALPAARAHVDEDEEGDDAGGDHGRIHGRQQDHCNERRRLLMSKEAGVHKMLLPCIGCVNASSRNYVPHPCKDRFIFIQCH